MLHSSSVPHSYTAQGLKMQAVSYSETEMNIYQPTMHHFLEPRVVITAVLRKLILDSYFI